MDINFLELFIGAVLSGTVEALVGRAVDATPRVAKRAQRLLSMTEAQSLSATEAAVREAVIAARQDLLDAYADDEHGLGEDVVRDLESLLNHPPFAEEVARRLLYRGQPDFDRLRQAYIDLKQPGTDEPISERWQALELPLLDFFEAIERRLYADPTLGPLLRDTKKLAELTALKDSNQIIAEASRSVQAYQARIAGASEQSATGIQALLRTSGQQEAHLGQIVELLTRALAELAPAGQMPIVSTTALSQTETAYLRLLAAACNRLPLAENKRATGDIGARRAELANVYVDLQTTASPTLDLVFDRLDVPEAERSALADALRKRIRETGGKRGTDEGVETETLGVEQLLRGGEPDDFDSHPLRPWAENQDRLAAALAPMTALEVMARHQRLVLLGKPGSGKSTLVNHLAYTMACKLLGEDLECWAALQDQFPAPLFPLRVVLRRWSATLGRKHKAGVDLVYQALEMNTPCADRQALLARLERSDTLVLFDGLDETPAADADDPNALDRRRLIVDSVADFCVAHPNCRVLVTSRVKPYEGSDYRLPDLEALKLADLDDGRIQRFIHRWYDELASVASLTPGQASHVRGRLLRALQTRKDLRDMAGTPLLLTMLAKVNASAGLPENRAELYDECVQQLLWELEKSKDWGEDEAGHAANLESLLKAPGVDLNRGDVERVLWKLTFDLHGESGERTADLPASKLAERLAAIHPQVHAGKAWASRVVALMQDRGGLLVESDTDVFTYPHRTFQEYMAARWLLEDENRPQVACRLAGSDIWQEVVLLACGYLAAKSRINDLQPILFELASSDTQTPEDRRRLLVAGQAWLEFGPHRATGELGAELRQRLPRRLTALMQGRKVSPAQRLAAGLILADLNVLPDDLDRFVPIPARKKLGYDFQIGRYPVTNAQYRRFVDAGGYDQSQPWWDKAAVEDILRFWSKWPAGPRLWGDPRFDKSTQPVVGISWHEARAYCSWLSESLRHAGAINRNEAVFLPTEAEWAWAASGAADRRYPWGEDFDPWRVNSEESGLGQPTPVHMYPDGRTPEEVWDLAGNVWEWSNDEYKDWGKVLVGGSAWNDANRVTAAARYRGYPGGWVDDGGFRVVVVPISRVRS